MIKIDYPSYHPKIKKEKTKEFIFDEVRKKWVSLTPEEWVRQYILQYLTGVKKYPASLIAVEKEIQLNELRKRIDILIYDTDTQPWMMIECKEMNVTLNEKTVQQILRYHSALPVPYLIITNGHYCFGFEKNGDNFIEINDFPDVNTGINKK